MQDLLGKDRGVLAAMTLPAGTRVITPGMAVTEDYSAARLNSTTGTPAYAVFSCCSFS